ncbi:MAG: hypothetical protein ACXWPM_08180 [Bdellovibrionota bacterium]
MKTVWILLTFALFIKIPIASALDTKDVYCAEDPKLMPTYFEDVHRSCGKDLQGMCTQTVTCTTLTPDMKVDRKVLDALQGNDRRVYLGDHKAKWVTATLICQGSDSPDGPICPSPEQCKGDTYYGSHQAMNDPKTFEAIAKRKATGDSRIFQVEPQVKGAK